MTPRVWGTQEFAAGDEWWAPDGTSDSGSIIFPPDADSFDPDGVFPAWYAGGSDGTFHYHIAVDSDGLWWVDKFNASMTVLLDRWPLPTVASSSSWVQLADLPGGSSTSISEHAVAVIGDHVYATGGVLANVFGAPVTDFANYYDESAATWVAVANMPAVRASHGSAVIGTKLYVVGGHDNTPSYRTSLYEYNEGTNTWATKAALGTARQSNACAAVGTKLYTFGGYNGAVMSNVDCWDQGANTWSAKAALPVALMNAAAVAVGTDIFVFGGFDGTSIVATVYKYDTVGNSWTTLGAAPAPMAPLNGAALIGSLIYVCEGGIDDPVGGNLDKTTLRSYDPSADTWGTEDPLPVYRLAIVGGTSTHLYVVAGYNFSQTFNTLYAWSSTAVADNHVPIADVQHVTADATNVVVVSDIEDAVGTHIGLDVVIYDLTGSVLDEWPITTTDRLADFTGSCLTGGSVVFGTRVIGGAWYVTTVDLSDGSRSDVGVFTIDSAITALDGTWNNLSNVRGIVAVGTDLIICGQHGIARVQADGTPVWWSPCQDGTAEYRGLAHSGTGSVWACDSNLNADEYLEDGTYVQTIVLPEFAVQAWLANGPSGGWSVDVIAF